MTPPAPQLTVPQALPPPIFGQPQGKKPQAKPSTPTVLGSAADPAKNQTAPKTLLGQ